MASDHDRLLQRLERIERALREKQRIAGEHADRPETRLVADPEGQGGYLFVEGNRGSKRDTGERFTHLLLAVSIRAAFDLGDQKRRHIGALDGQNPFAALDPARHGAGDQQARRCADHERFASRDGDALALQAILGQARHKMVISLGGHFRDCDGGRLLGILETAETLGQNHVVKRNDSDARGGGKTASAADAPCSVRMKPSAATSEPLIVSSEKPVASGLERASHLAQGEIKPPPLRQEIRTAGDQAVDAVID